MQTLIVELENREYHYFQHLAQQFGTTPEEMTVQWVRIAIEEIQHPRTNLSTASTLDDPSTDDGQAEETMAENPDPLLALAGTLEYKATDLSERHDEYIGQTLLTEMQGNKNE